ncbi:MAG: PKD domain-containing protein [Thermoplasmata archaeon]|nr:PKD domain-containing protein [Thermoplasmata archaeon]MBE3136932.1 PKD domain-containing protein [Thermoplasmata archaeon]
MIKKIICIVICMTLFATVLAVAQPETNKESIETTDANPGNNSPIQPLAMWDQQLSFDVSVASGALGNAGAEFDGTNLYSTRWASNLIHRYDTSGVMIEQFSIAGVTGLRDLAYDGTQYMYGGATAGTIWKMDFTTKTLVATLTGSFQCRAIAYDTDLNVIYCKNWADPCYVVNPTTGAVISTFNLVSTVSTYGLAYDNLTPGGPFLWVWDQGGGAGTPQYIKQWDLAAGAFTSVQHDVAVDFPAIACIAGGLWFSADFVSGKTTLGGLAQGTPDTYVCYEIGNSSANTPPVTPGAPSGPSTGNVGVEYDFTASTTDPDTDDIYYLFDWGDGNDSGWLGPFASGATATGSYTWSAIGDYDVKVKAKDVNDAESGWSAVHPITISAPAPNLEIQAITGGLFKVKTTIKNTGTAAATNVSWSIKLDGGLILLGKETTGNIPTIAAGGSEAISSKLILGFGKTVITVTAGTATKSQNATVLLVFIKI